MVSNRYLEFEFLPILKANPQIQDFHQYLILLNKNPLLNNPPLFKKDFSDFRFRLNKTPPIRLKKFLTKILMFSVDIIYFPHTFASYYLIRFFIQLTETNFQLWLLCAAHKSMESIKSKPISTIAYLNIKYSMMMIYQQIRKFILNIPRERALEIFQVLLRSNIIELYFLCCV